MSIYIHRGEYVIPGGSIEEVLNASKAPFQSWGEYHAGKVQLPAPDDEISRKWSRQDRVTRIALGLVERMSDSKAELLILGSARGATATLEKEHSRFLDSGKVSTRTSPLTTPGNIASAAASLTGLQARNHSLSMTCSSGLNALIQAAEQIDNGRFKFVIAGGVEAPLTLFTRAQFEALRLLSKEQNDWPCLTLGKKRSNQLVLSEGGAIFELSCNKSSFKISGWGESAQHLESDTAFAQEAVKASMEQALAMSKVKPDLVIAHAPGTLKGDAGEREVIDQVLGNNQSVFSTKKYTGHSLGASGAVSLAFALEFLSKGYTTKNGEQAEIKSVMINATGFGGNAASLVVEKV